MSLSRLLKRGLWEHSEEHIYGEIEMDRTYDTLYGAEKTPEQGRQWLRQRQLRALEERHDMLVLTDLRRSHLVFLREKKP